MTITESAVVLDPTYVSPRGTRVLVEERPQHQEQPLEYVSASHDSCRRWGMQSLHSCIGAKAAVAEHVEFRACARYMAYKLPNHARHMIHDAGYLTVIALGR
jgi:hypothetical protein